MEKILKILAFAGALIACVILAIIGFATQRYEYLALLPFGLFGSITGFMYGVKGRPTATIDPPGTGGKFMGLPDWVTVIDAILLLAGILVIVLVQVL
jgi:hypothetical protein